MALTATVTPGKTFVGTERATNSKLNQGFAPTVALTGTADTSDITNDAVTAAKLAFGAVYYCAASGTNAITLTASGHTITLVEGMMANFEAANTTTGAVTIIFGGSTLALYRNHNVAVGAGDLRAGQQVEIRYDGAAWQLMSPSGNAAVVSGIDAGSTDAYAITPTPSVRALADITGVPVVFKAATINTGAATLTIFGLAATPIVKSYNVVLSDGDIKAGQWVTVVYDGTSFQLQSPVTSGDPAIVRSIGTGILLKNTTGAAGKVDLTATELVLKGGANLSQLASALSVAAIDIDGGTGLLKRDTGNAAVGWWYVYAVGNGTSVSGCLSTSATGPDFSNMAGYSYWALIGAVYCSGVGSPSTLSTVHQVDRTVYVATTASSSTTDTATLWNAVAGVSTILPPIARTVRGVAGANTAFDGLVSVAGNSTGTLGLQTVSGRNGAPTISSFYWAGDFDVPLPTAQTFYYMTNAAGTYRITISGYTI